MKLSLIIAALILLLTNPSIGQSLDLRLEGDQLRIRNNGNFKPTYLESKAFQKLDWQPGYAYYLDGSSRKFDGMKYNPQMDLIQVSTNENLLTLLPGVVNGVSMETASEIDRIFLKVPLEKPVFMEALSIGKIHLLIYRNVKDEGPGLDLGEVEIRLEKEEKIVEFDEIIYIWSAEGVSKLKSSRKAILSLMADQESEINKFMDSTSIKLKSPADILRLFQFYNSLQANE